MTDVTNALAANRNAADELMKEADACADVWTVARAPGKWSPAQLVEHVARAFDESTRLLAGEATAFPRLPTILRPVVRGLFFNRIIRTGRFPNAKTNSAMDPASGPATAAEGRDRLTSAMDRFEHQCRSTAERTDTVQTTTFGAVGLVDYTMFQAHHTRHHGKQMAEQAAAVAPR